MFLSRATYDDPGLLRKGLNEMPTATTTDIAVETTTITTTVATTRATTRATTTTEATTKISR